MLPNIIHKVNRTKQVKLMNGRWWYQMMRQNQLKAHYHYPKQCITSLKRLAAVIAGLAVSVISAMGGLVIKGVNAYSNWQ